eukprot:320210-Pleurochrysis_carterae.AAC.1
MRECGRAWARVCAQCVLLSACAFVCENARAEEGARGRARAREGGRAGGRVRKSARESARAAPS